MPGPLVAILLPDDVERAAGRHGPRRDDPARAAGEDLVAGDAAGVEVRGRRRPGRCPRSRPTTTLSSTRSPAAKRPILSPTPASIAGSARRRRCARSVTSAADAGRARSRSRRPRGRTRGRRGRAGSRATTLRSRTAAGAPAPLTIARFSTATAAELLIVSAVPRATRIVAGPWPRMRSDRACSTVSADARRRRRRPRGRRSRRRPPSPGRSPPGS